MIFAKSFMILSLFTSYNAVEIKQYAPPPPNILSVESNYPRDGIWVRVPKGTKKITFNVRAENTETVLFWLMPTGTGTWNQRKLIGYDIKENDKDIEFNLIWNIERSSLLDHLHIQALGEGIANDTINLIMRNSSPLLS